MSDEDGEEALAYTRHQLKLFKEVIATVEERWGKRFRLRHCANTGATARYPETHLDMVRPGLLLYGYGEFAQEMGLKPVMSLKTAVQTIKHYPAGTKISYGGTYTTSAEKTRIATIPVGYGDGYPRSLSGKGYVLICGKKAPILGRVCMDQTMVDITHIPEAREGSLVTLIGRDGGESITMEQLGDLSGRFNYELACDINPRVPRVICGGTLG
jgi:alanine racemase